ncbi:hypothetical protein DID74_02455 [Candidatus Marinamargulisbacteria bacterium SCGC AG-333-B06]|nr:hypothetical protein DID74_02455 [Candidatus Marinamargulisbacteria bacterium SCGC AG-333-B06]
MKKINNLLLNSYYNKNNPPKPLSSSPAIPVKDTFVLKANNNTKHITYVVGHPSKDDLTKYQSPLNYETIEGSHIIGLIKKNQIIIFDKNSLVELYDSNPKSYTNLLELYNLNSKKLFKITQVDESKTPIILSGSPFDIKEKNTLEIYKQNMGQYLATCHGPLYGLIAISMLSLGMTLLPILGNIRGKLLYPFTVTFANTLVMLSNATNCCFGFKTYTAPLIMLGIFGNIMTLNKAYSLGIIAATIGSAASGANSYKNLYNSDSQKTQFIRRNINQAIDNFIDQKTKKLI